MLLDYLASSPVVFDKGRGAFVKGRGPQARQTRCKLHEVHAVQLLGTTRINGKNAYTVYEMNLV